VIIRCDKHNLRQLSGGIYIWATKSQEICSSGSWPARELMELELSDFPECSVDTLLFIERHPQ
jgi:hypothetical protein